MNSTSTALLAYVLLAGLATGASAHSVTMSNPNATSETDESTTTSNSDNSRPLSSYDLNDSDDVKAFWERRNRSNN